MRYIGSLSLGSPKLESIDNAAFCSWYPPSTTKYLHHKRMTHLCTIITSKYTYIIYPSTQLKITSNWRIDEQYTTTTSDPRLRTQENDEATIHKFGLTHVQVAPPIATLYRPVRRTNDCSESIFILDLSTLRSYFIIIVTFPSIQ